MKKIISCLLVMIFMFSISSVGSFAKVGDTLLAEQTFDHLDAGYIYPRQSSDSNKWQLNYGSSDTGTSVVIEAEDGNNVAKITNTKYVEFFNHKFNSVDEAVFTVSYKAKFDDKNAPRYLQLKAKDGVSGIVLTFEKNGTVTLGDNSSSRKTLKNENGDNYIYDTNKWYNVNVVVDSSKDLIDLNLDDGTKNYSAEWKITNDYNKLTYLYFYNQSATTGTTSVMYIDDVSVVGGGLINTVDINFDNYTTSDDSVALTIGKTNTVTPVYSYVERDNGNMALKVDLPGDIGYWQAQKLHSDLKYSSGVVLAQTDIYFPDKSLNRKLCIRTDNGQTPIVSFLKDGSVIVGSTTYSSNVFKYMSGVDAPWYNVKAYFDISTGKVRAEISDGTNTKVFHSALSMDSAKRAVWGIEYLIQKNGSTTNNVSSYFDNLSLSSYVNENADFFTADYVYDFDNVTKLLSNGADYYQNANDGWYVQNVRASDDTEDSAEAVPADIDGRKVLKVQSLGKTHFEVLNWMPSFGVIRYSIDMRIDGNNEIRLAARGKTVDDSDASLTTFCTISDNTVKLAGGSELGDIEAEKWYRYAFEFDMDSATYTAKLIDLENNTSVTSESVTIPTDLRTITAIEFWMPNSANIFYLDNVCYSGNTTFAVVSDTNNGTIVDAAYGVDVITNDMIDPSATTYTLNNENNGAWIDANELGKANFGYLEPDTEYTLNYTVANLYGETIDGVIEFTTDTYGYGFNALTLSKDVISSGEIIANVNGRLSRGEEAQLIVAVYNKDESSELVEVKIVPITSVKEIKDYSAMVNVPDDGARYAVKAFLWDGNKPLLVNVGI